MSKHKIPIWHSRRSRETTALPVTFTQEHNTDIDLSPAIASPSSQSAFQVNECVIPEQADDVESREDSLFSDAREELLELKKAVTRFREKTHAVHHPEVNIDLEKGSWAEVKAEVYLAKNREEGKDLDSKAAKTYCARIAENIPVFENWLSLLPAGDYGSVVCGVFKIVVGAANQVNDVRVTVLGALADIPDWIAHASGYRDIYSCAENISLELPLMKKTAQLCGAVLIALRCVMEYFAEGTLKRAFGAIIQGTAYKRSLLQHLEIVKVLASKMDLESSVSSQRRLKAVEESTRRQEAQNAKMLTLLEELLQRPSVDPQEAAKLIGVHINNHFHSLVSSRPKLSIINQVVAAPSFESPSSPRSTIGHNDPPVPQSVHSFEASSLIGEEVKKQIVQKDTIFSILQSPKDVPYLDLERCQHKSMALDLAGQDRVKWMMRAQSLRQWLNCPTSCTLLINGNMPGSDVFSPTTILCAQLLHSLRIVSPIITIHFFCSLHTMCRDGLEDNATGLFKSLITQLLMQDLTWDLSFISSEDLDQLEGDDFDTTAMLFGELIRQLPTTTFMFWVIDSIAYYERSSRRMDFVRLIDQLLDIMEQSQTVVVKLLLTCDGKSAFVKELVSKDDILIVPYKVDGDLQGWSEHVWERTVGQELDNFEET